MEKKMEKEKNKLKFEGEYINDQRWNGNGYNINDNIDIEIKDGKWNMKKYSHNGILKI